MPDKFNELLLKQDIIELYNAGITPDYGYLMNGRFEKDMVKTLYPLKTLSGNPISWEASDTEYLFPVVSLEPNQAGSGDPSPENVRPISGYDSVTVNARGKNLFDANSGFALYGNASIYGFAFDGEFLKEGVTYSFFAKNSTEVVNIKVSYVSYGENQLEVSIPVGSNEQVTFHRNPNAQSPKLYVFLSVGGTEYGTGVQITSIEQAKALNLQIEVGSTPTPYEPYQPGTTATITLPETIYGGTVDVVTGVGSNEAIMFELAIADMDNDEKYPGWREVPYLTDIVGAGYNGGINDEILKTCNIVKSAFNDTNTSYISINTRGTNSILYLTQAAFGLTQTQWKEQYPDLVVQICLKRISPEPFQATGNQQLTSLTGYNTIYTNGESIKLNRKARRLEV